LTIDEPPVYGILLHRPGFKDAFTGPDFTRTATGRTGSDPRWGRLDEWALNLAPSPDGWTISYGTREEVLTDALLLRAEIDAAITVLEDEGEPPCKHRQPRSHTWPGPGSPFRHAAIWPEMPCTQCAADEHAAWVAGVEAKFTAAIEAIRRGEPFTWEPQPPTEDAVNAAVLAKNAPDWSQDLQDAVEAAHWPDDGYPKPPADGSYESLQRYANVRVLAEMLRGEEDIDERMLGIPVPRATPAERWVRAGQLFDRMQAETAEQERQEAVLAQRIAEDPDLARMEAAFTVAKEACRIGHDAGCTYGGMSSAYGYWLIREDCDLAHGDTCAIRYACDGDDATTGFVGREPADWIWVVPACQPCADAYAAKRPEYRRPTMEDKAAREREAEAFLSEAHTLASTTVPIEFTGILGMLEGDLTAPQWDTSGIDLNEATLKRFLPPAPNPNGDPMSDETTETQASDDPSAENPKRPEGCYEHASGTWIHVAGHVNCPAWLHGKLPSRRRMQP
jgi:hypothetical protein